MSEINCESCGNLRENAPDFVTNGVTDDIAASLEANTGFNPNLDVLHDNCEDLNDANDCLIGMLSSEIETYSQCDWKTFTQTAFGNLYEMLKAMIASDCGQWDYIGQSLTPEFCQAGGTAASQASGTSHVKVVIDTVLLDSDPNSIFTVTDGGIKVSEAGVYRVSGSIYIVPTADTRAVGSYIYVGQDYATSIEVVSLLCGVGEGAMSRTVYSGSRLVSLNADDIVYLCSRTTYDAGTVEPNHATTFLQVEKVQ